MRFSKSTLSLNQFTQKLASGLLVQCPKEKGPNRLDSGQVGQQ